MIREFELNGILLSPAFKRDTVTFTVTDLKTNSWIQLTVDIHEFYAYAENYDELFWGVESPVQIRRKLNKLTDTEYVKFIYGFVSDYFMGCLTPKEITSMASHVFDLFNPVWN